MLLLKLVSEDLGKDLRSLLVRDKDEFCSMMGFPGLWWIILHRTATFAGPYLYAQNTR